MSLKVVTTKWVLKKIVENKSKTQKLREKQAYVSLKSINANLTTFLISSYLKINK